MSNSVEPSKGHTGEDTPISDKSPEAEAAGEEEALFDNKFQIWRNILVICTGFLFLFTAFQSLQALASSLFIGDGLGTTGLAVLYGSLVLSSFFIPTPLVKVVGCKWTLTIAMACYIMFMVAHFYARPEVYIPAAIIVGLGAAPLWTSKCTYLNQAAHDYAKKTGTSVDSATNLFFGVFFLFFQSTSVWGNVISSQILAPDNSSSAISPLTEEQLSLCGKGFCPQDLAANPNNTNLDPPDRDQLFMLAGIYTGCACVAVAIVLIFLQQLPAERLKSKCSGCVCSREVLKPSIIAATFYHLKDYRQVLLIPLTMFSGLEQAFLSGDFTQAFITCPLGRWWIGYVLICYGVVDACCSLLFGRLVQYVGRIPFFILGFLINGSLIITFLIIDITQDNLYLYFVYAGLWGMADGIWQTQLNALYGVLFRESTEAAYSNYRLWESLGFIIAFTYQSRLCLPIKAYILGAFLIVGVSLYLVVEYKEWRKRKAGFVVE